MPSPDSADGMNSSQETDACARSRAWAQALGGIGRADEACLVLQKALEDHPGDQEVARDLATLLLADGKADMAARAVADLSTTDRRTSGLVGEICHAQGRHANAVAAFGQRAGLSRTQRRLRMRSWWRSGGPVRWVRPDGTGRNGATNTLAGGPQAGGAIPSPASSPELSDSLLEAATWAEWLSARDRFDGHAGSCPKLSPHTVGTLDWCAAPRRLKTLPMPSIQRCFCSVRRTGPIPPTLTRLWSGDGPGVHVGHARRGPTSR